MSSSPGLSVRQSYDIDAKIDDGLPESGNVIATLISGADVCFASGLVPYYIIAGGNAAYCGFGAAPLPYTLATQGTSTTCSDNSTINNGTQKYSIEIANGSGVNCALSFKFQ